jgi:hypothetical protein
VSLCFANQSLTAMRAKFHFLIHFIHRRDAEVAKGSKILFCVERTQNKILQPLRGKYSSGYKLNFKVNSRVKFKRTVLK